MTKIEELIKYIDDSCIVNLDDALGVLQTVRDELMDLESKINFTKTKHELFLYRYYKAGYTSDREDWYSSATAAKSFHYSLKSIGIIPNFDDEIQKDVNSQFKF